MYRCLICVLALIASHAALANANWVEYRSTNFVLYTDEPATRAEPLLRNFEQFRSVVLQYMNLEDRPENQRMMILMYSDRREFHSLVENGVGGFYLNTTAGPRMVVGPADSFSDSEVILFHEYSHYLLREHSQIHYPRWYDEGLAEVLASIVIEEDRVLLGALHPWRRHRLRLPRWHRLEKLMYPGDRRKSHGYWAQYYASAWLTVHYLELGVLSGAPDYSQETRQYLTLYNQGVDSREAFEQALGKSLSELDREIRRYRRNRFTRVLDFPTTPYEEPLASRALTTNQTQTLLAELAWRIGKEEVALAYLSDLDPEQTDAAAGLALRAVLHNHADNLAQAQGDLTAALTLNEDNLSVLANAAHFHWDRYETLLEQEEEREEEQQDGQEGERESASEHLARSLSFSGQATSLDPEYLEALHFKALAHQHLDQPAPALESLIAIYRQLPSDLNINITIGKYLLQLRRPDLAHPFLERAQRWVHSAEDEERLAPLLEQLESDEQTEQESVSGEDTPD